MTDRDSARAAKERLRTELAPLGGVGGIGIGRRDGSYVVTVDVVDETDGRQVPTTWDGVDVEVRVTGRVVPLGASGVPGAQQAGPVTSGPAAGTEGRWRQAGPAGPGTGR